MTKKQRLAHEIYSKTNDNDKITEDFLYNALCFFSDEIQVATDNVENETKNGGVSIDGEIFYTDKVMEKILTFTDEDIEKLTVNFNEIRGFTKNILTETLKSGLFSEAFHDTELEDIIFFQISHGQDIH